ncbi:MAG: esterase/lipase family protein [Acutalibacteraceae bacterium]
MAVSVLVPSFSAFAVDPKDKNPIVYLRGNGNPIYDAEGYCAYPLNISDEEMQASVKRVVFPYLVNAVLFGKWDEYYDAFEKEVADKFSRASLDENGNIANDSGIANASYETNRANMDMDKTYSDGNSGLFSYTFWYDWRLDPLEVADSLNEYIEHILAATGAEKVSIVGKCLGGGFVLAYLAKYGYDNIRNIAFDCTVGNGCENLSDIFSGNIHVDTEAIERSAIDDNLPFVDNPGEYLNDFIIASIDLLNERDVCKLSEKTINWLYKKLYKELTPRLCMASFGTWPGYWTNITKDQYQTAKDIMFNGAVPENAVKYAGLIEKLDNYDRLVRQRIPEVLLGAKAVGVNVGILAKYGYQLPCYIESRDMLGDSLVSLHLASFGATCSNVYDTLSDEYIAERTAAGYGKYISPDKQVDASTCLFPDSTWIIKGMTHENWADCNDSLIYKICTTKEGLTIDSSEKYPQFMVYSDSDDDIYKMTTENCNTTNWDGPGIKKHNICTYFEAVIKWLKTLVALVKSKLTAK